MKSIAEKSGDWQVDFLAEVLMVVSSRIPFDPPNVSPISTTELKWSLLNEHPDLFATVVVFSHTDYLDIAALQVACIRNYAVAVN